MSEGTPKLSVVMITYNHEKYIEQAVRSVLMQETDFEYEIIIGEDCSTDRTREILIELQRENPEKIKLVLIPQNQGMIPNFVNVLSMAQGEYIALLEGDDYWTSPHKLQRQVDYMEAHPECRICFHAAQVIYEDNPSRTEILKPRPMPRRGQPISITAWQRTLFIATCTVVYRAVAAPIPGWYSELRNAGDWPLFLWLILNGGEMRYLHESEPFAVYRKHRAGVTYPSSMIGSPQRRARLFQALNDVTLVRKSLKGHRRMYVRPRALNLHLSLANDFLATGDIVNSRVHVLKAISYLSPSRQELKRILRLAVQCFLPKLYPKLLSLNSHLRTVYGAGKERTTR